LVQETAIPHESEKNKAQTTELRCISQKTTVMPT
jgi:hypothetical protein